MQQLKAKIGKWFRSSSIYQQVKLQKFASLQHEGLPAVIEPAVLWMVSQQLPDNLQQLMSQVEQRRHELAATPGEVEIWYSPRPGSAGHSPDSLTKPAPGETKSFSMSRIAHTGKDRVSAMMLHLLARQHQAQYAIELGACAGLSAAYLAAVPTMKQLWTVEGAPQLARIAEQTLQPWHPNARVFTGHFDDAIDVLAPQHAGLWDFAYIDGHHEKIATIHYFNRLLPYLKPGAMVIFDDISWSRDMREGWQVLQNRPEFADTIDFGSVGVGLLQSSQQATGLPKRWNLQPVLGKHKIGQPSGWKS